MCQTFIDVGISVNADDCEYADASVCANENTDAYMAVCAHVGPDVNVGAAVDVCG